MRLLHGLGASADCNSVGEIEVALKAGFTADQIVFTGVGKSGAEIARAVALGLKAINAESRGELERIDAESVRQGRRTRVALRVNPDVDAKTHPNISTGMKRNKFGVPIGDARGCCSPTWPGGPGSRWSASTSTSVRRSPRWSRCPAPPSG